MAKKHVRKSSKNVVRTRRHKTLGYYLFVYLVCLVVGVVIFVTGEMLTRSQPLCANSGSCNSDQRLKIENGVPGMFQGRKVIPPTIPVSSDESRPPVLGDSTTSQEKHIYVDLSTQILYAYEGTTKILQTYVSTGRWNKTPTGNFHIWEKLRSTRMKGGEGDDAYDLPNVPYVMYFYNDFGLHGAYWHDNFGHTMSHGCVNLRQIDAKTLYDWADGPQGKTLGTEVSVCDHFTEPNTCVQSDPLKS